MPIDINPAVPAGRQIIQAYGDRRFKIAGDAIDGSVLVFAERFEPWPVTAPDAVSMDALGAVVAARDEVEILLVGCGPTFAAVPRGLRAALKEHGIVLEWMDTGAACRTFNVLLAEERRVAAALIAVD